MYARTRKGICKILETYEDICLVDKNGTIHSDSSFNEYIRVEDIVKSSKDIIDLIEVGDYVNGMRVLRVGNIITVILDNEENISWVKPADIKTVLTKEQFENNVYRIGE